MNCVPFPGGEENIDQCIRDYEEIGRLSPDEDAREIRSKIQQVRLTHHLHEDKETITYMRVKYAVRQH
jgi:hypothetical protein